MVSKMSQLQTLTCLQVYVAVSLSIFLPMDKIWSQLHTLINLLVYVALCFRIYTNVQDLILVP